MANNDRDRRLLDASVLHDAIDSLSKVKEEQRIEFIHDRMMSAIDDICKTHQGTGKEKFTTAQISILKDVVFHVIYILDSRNRPTRGFLRRLWEDFAAEKPMKQVGIAATVLTVLSGTAYSAVNIVNKWVVPYFTSLDHVKIPEKKTPAEIPSQQVAPTPTVPPSYMTQPHQSGLPAQSNKDPYIPKR